MGYGDEGKESRGGTMVADTRVHGSVPPSIGIEHALDIQPSDGVDGHAESTALGSALVEAVGVGASIEVAPFLSVLARGDVVVAELRERSSDIG